MIPQSLIDKYGLVKTDMQNGRSFINNVSVWRMNQEDYKMVLISDGDIQGEPMPDGQVFIWVHKEKQWQSAHAPIEMLLDIDANIIHKFINWMFL